MSPIKLLSVASEIFPLVKTGGLADVVGTLPGALAQEGVTVRSLVPGYPAVIAALGKTERLRHWDRLFGGAADLLAGLDERRPLDGGLLRGAPGVPLARMPGGDAEHARAAGADEDRQRCLDRLGIAGRVGDVVAGTVERGRVLRQHRRDDLDGLLETAHPLPGRLQFDAIGVVLVDLPARAEPEDETTSGQPVKSSSAVGEQRRMVDRRGRDQGPDPDPLGDRREGGQQGPALVRVAARGRRVPGVRHVVVREPDAVPATAVGGAHLRQDVSRGAVVRGPK